MPILKPAKKTYCVGGLDCASCASMIELDLEEIGICAKCSYSKGTLEIEEPHNEKQVIEIVKKAGYSIK
jgi:copper chaperone CopZ